MPTSSSTPPSQSASTKRSAFAELMSPKKPKEARSSTRPQNNTNPNDPRNGLLAYIQQPDAFPASRVITYNKDTVLIFDMYPKATLHLLLLPRDPTKYNLPPQEAFADPAFLSLMQSEAAKAVTLAASELRRLLSSHSKSDAARTAALDGLDPSDLDSSTTTDKLPTGRNYAAEFRVGVHAHPSMAHLHIHILSPDMHSASLKHRSHYNSFTTPFFLPLADFPLAADDERRAVGFQNANLRTHELVCWRCSRGFGDRFVKLKTHLEKEWAAWRAE